MAAELRIGVEFLPPEQNGLQVAPEPPRAEALHEGGGDDDRRTAPVSTARRTPSLREQVETPHLWLMRSEDLAAVRDPLAGETLRFIHDVLGEDNRRIRREIGTPLLGRHYFDLSATNLPTHGDEVLAEEETAALAEYGPRLLRKPMRNLLRRTWPVRAVALELDSFKADNLPLSEPYGANHPYSRKSDRMAMRVRVDNPSDPVELSFISSAGLRVGSGQENLKLGFSHWLTDNLALGLQSQCRYDQGRWSMRGDLTWYADKQTSFQIVVSDNLDFLDTTTIYSLFETPMDGSPGFLLHAVHLF